MPTKDEIKTFSEVVEKIVAEGGSSYLDAITHHGASLGMEPEIAAKLVSPAIKAKLREEAENLNFIKRTKARLPV